MSKNSEGDMNGGWGGFGYRPSQHVTVDEAKETREILQQFRVATLVIWGVMWLYYVSLNFALGIGDWYAVVRGTQFAFCVGVFLYIRQFMWNHVDTYFLAGDKGNPDSGYIGTHTIVSLVISAVLFVGLATQTSDFLVTTLRYPENMPLFFQGIPYVIRFGVITLALSVTLPAISIILRLVFREIPDQFHAAEEIEKRRQELEIDWAKLEFEKEKYYDNRKPTQGTDKITVSLPTPINAPMRTKSYPTNEARGADALREFVEMIGSGEITTSQSSWKDKRLSRSKVPLTVSFGNAMRDMLINAGLAEWNHPTAVEQGWKLNPKMDVDNIIAHITDEFVHSSGIDMFRQ